MCAASLSQDFSAWLREAKVYELVFGPRMPLDKQEYKQKARQTAPSARHCLALSRRAQCWALPCTLYTPTSAVVCTGHAVAAVRAL